MSQSPVADQYLKIQRRISDACRRSARQPGEVTLVGASKRQSISRLEQAFASGLRCFGENRVQEAASKIPKLPVSIDWQLIGPLQSNKVARAVELFSTVHSIDRLKIARALGKHAAALGRTIHGFLQVNVGQEESKHGFSPDQLLGLDTLDQLLGIEALEISGLMAIPPRAKQPKDARRWFRQLRNLSDEIRSTHPIGNGLSMGMSSDFEIAIEEGATHIRLGSVLFGERPD